MNTQKIKFTVNGEVKEIEVQSCYSYVSNSAQGRSVLRLSVNEADAGFRDLQALKQNESGEIEFYERTVDPESGEAGEWVLKNVYEGYNAGEVEISYQNGQYSCEVTRMGKYEEMVAQNKADIEFLSIMAGISLA